ncbi:hypothetical protein ACIO6U_09605 [Streptomyces sp. NPDC087422]|uniref:hypothetical protein n=1 Tax=Streptomyces sp. NPDC087422 TaxID=3365786 RepID=UPI003806473C
MIPKITEGSGGTYGLITYLYGPGKANEHTDQHMVASWNGFAPDPGPTASREAITKLARQLDLPVKSLPREQRPKTTIWHCSVRTAAEDRPLNDDDDGEVADQLVGIGEVLDALAQTSPANTRAELQAAARSFERATRSHIQASNSHNQALRRAARALIQSGMALGKGEDGAATAMLLSILITAAVMAAHWHAARGHAQQAAASRQIATQLRAAYQAAANAPLTTMRTTGQSLPAPARHEAFANIQAVLPKEAARIQAEPNWPALAATLTEAAQSGHDPVALLHRVVDTHELTTADSLSDVLLWRLRHEANLPATPPSAAQRQPQRRQAPTAPATVPMPSQASTRRR